MPVDGLLGDVPPAVVRVQEVLAAPGRLVILRHLLDGPLTFIEVRERVGLSAAGVRSGLAELAALGYVSDDSPVERQRKSPSARFTVDRVRVLEDLMALVVYLAA